MLSELSWTLRPVEAGQIKVAYPIELRNLFLGLLRQHDPGLADLCQAASGNRPFTLSPLLGPMMRIEDQFYLARDLPYTWRITGLTEPIHTVLQQLAKDHPAEIELLGIKLRVAVKTWRDQSYEELCRRWLSRIELPDQCTLTFITPTAFHQEQVDLPLPIPRLLFHHYWERWHHFSNISLGGELLLPSLEVSVSIARQETCTQLVAVEDSRLVGYMGAVDLIIVGRADRRLRQIINLLAEFAPWAGTGFNTSLGMGQTALMEHPERLEQWPKFVTEGI